MFDSFLRIVVGLVVLAVIAVVVIASLEVLFPLLVIVGIGYAVYHVARGLS